MNRRDQGSGEGLTSYEQRVGSLLARWVGWVQLRPVVCIGVVLAVTGLAGAYTAGNLGVNADEDAMLSADLPYRVAQIEYESLFPVLYENAVVVVDGPSPELARDATIALADRLRAAPELFHNVYLPRGPFFEEHALLYLSTEELEDFGDRLARVQPYLTGLAQDGTLRGLALLLARGVRGVRDGAFEADQLASVLGRVDHSLAGWLAGDPLPFSWAEVVAGRDLDADANRAFILAQPVLNFADVSPARKPLGAVKEIAAELGLTAAAGYRVRTTGDVALAYEEMSIVEGQASRAGLASLVLVTAILFFALRSGRMVFATVATLVVGLVWTAGFAAFVIGHLNLISVAFAVLFIGLAVDFGLHFSLRYQELLNAGAPPREAMPESARGVGTSLLLCAFTTAIGFYAFVPTDFSGVAELGLISGSGMFISLVLSFTLLPALLAVGSRASASPARRRRYRLPAFPIRYPRAVGLTALGVGVAALFVVPQVHFDRNPLKVRDPSAESVQMMQELLAKGSATPWELNAVVPDLESGEALAAELRALDSVERAFTVTDFIPEDQEEKLAIIEDVALFLPPLTGGDQAAPPSSADQVEGLRELRAELGRWQRESENAPGEHAELVERFDGNLERFLTRVEEEARVGGEGDASAFLGGLEERLLGTLHTQLDLLETALGASTVTLEKLPNALMERMVSREGMVRVRIMPSRDLSDDEALEAFVADVQSIAPNATGGAVRIYEASRAVVRAFQQAFISAVLVIALLLLVIWRTLGDTALVLIPLGLAALLTGASAVLLGIPFNFADVIVLPLLLGIGVDSGIHLVHRSRMLEGGDRNLLETSTARAVVFSSFTTIASFGTLGFASHLGMASLGQLLTLGVAITVVCNLVVLPALIEWRQRRRGRASLRESVA